ncbi:Cytochrome P450 monooxygenase ATR4 [Paramyrothecium foliicola]|nr:Cytochrome P450 monooxygenase ATR4 [Paramyrothecium foliicola]
MSANGTSAEGSLRAYGLPQEVVEETIQVLLLPKYVVVAGVALLWVWSISFLHRKPRIPGAKVHGYRGWWEPSFILKARFLLNASSIIESGYEKFKDVPFIVRRHDTEIHVMPMKYLDELRLTPKRDLNGKMAHYNNLLKVWSWGTVIRDSDLHSNVLTRKLNPEVGKYMAMASEELEYGWETDMPKPTEWTEVDIQHAVRMLVARMSAKVFLGSPACRDPEWLSLSLNFSIDVFFSCFTLRIFPPWMHFFIKPFIPARWRVQRQMNGAIKFFRAYMLKRAEDTATRNGSGEEPLYDWMVDHATEDEGSLEQMAARQCILTLASIHTTSMTVSNALFDLIANPEWVPVLREEINNVIKVYGRPGKNLDVKSWLQHLEKMDSFIVESQRLHPAILLSPQRMTIVPLVLKDGTMIPKDIRIAWAGPQHGFDPIVNVNPRRFDPLRSYRKRHANTGQNLNKFMAGQSDPHNMSFGYGSQVCPGRYFAVGEIKLVFMRLIQEFDFALPKGKGPPRVIHADENLILDLFAKVRMKKTGAKLEH